jgi:hypothetical protein
MQLIGVCLAMHSWSRQTYEMHEKAAMATDLKRRKFARQLHISEACRSGCKLHLERSTPPCQCSPPPLATVEKQRMRSRWRKPGKPREPNRKRLHFLQRPGFLLQAADPAGLRTPGLLILVLTTLLIAHVKAPGS